MNLNTPASTLLPAAIGAALNGGFFAGVFQQDGQLFGLVIAPRAEGEYHGRWNDDLDAVDGAQSYIDGPSNTVAMAAAGSALAKHAHALRIADFNDWYLPARDELELIYRNLKPTKDYNNHYGRHGENQAAVPPTYAYAEQLPPQTSAEAFQEGGSEAMVDTWYWSSTQHAGYADYAWLQHFHLGSQTFSHKSYAGRARFVRRFKL